MRRKLVRIRNKCQFYRNISYFEHVGVFTRIWLLTFNQATIVALITMVTWRLPSQSLRCPQMSLTYPLFLTDLTDGAIVTRALQGCKGESNVHK